MKKTNSIFRIAAFGLLGILNITTAWAERPNIVLIFADDLGWQEPAFCGSDYCETPHLDRLAADGGREMLDRNNAAELYNIATDPGERNNLALSQREKRNELLNDLLAWIARVPARIPSEPNPKWKGK
jgi:arylsulfatase A-like enzyme